MLYFEDYIMAAPAEAQKNLIDILLLIQDEFPHAEQRMYHGIPTFFHGKQDIINVGAYTNHIGLYVGYDIVDFLKQKYPSFEYAKASLKLPYIQPLPLDIITDIFAQIKSGMDNH